MVSISATLRRISKPYRQEGSKQFHLYQSCETAARRQSEASSLKATSTTPERQARADSSSSYINRHQPRDKHSTGHPNSEPSLLVFDECNIVKGELTQFWK
ncbi:hypothetical protein H0G86_009033 [Trichoderma simmonsii]|uniref:Uncharacterized protein n=1 Tax=Trichoderma simmonsii TaxID=1491479 RepID=A0A8G0LH66_9HYPO|nr:hypothetical protein H0G86_009033 [Trichoderma simmonsii]